jgi:NAD(P)-dependent dehydrogenase (short-subunit alcohol dehydrogenase family)
VYERTTEEFGAIDIVVSGAAGNFLAAATNLSPNAFKTVVDIDLIGTFNVLRTSWDYLTKPGASLISITAPQAVRPTPLQAHACAAKSGVNMLTKVLAMEWGPAGVRVNAISPGFIEGTEGTSRLTQGVDMPELLASVPLRRLGTKSDIANLAVYLTQDQGSFINGAILDCDGGYVLGASAGDPFTVQAS